MSRSIWIDELQKASWFGGPGYYPNMVVCTQTVYANQTTELGNSSLHYYDFFSIIYSMANVMLCATELIAYVRSLTLA